MVTLRDLQYLVAIDKHQHFGRAAEACFVSQPTLSGQFKKLEEHLGLTLVERNRHQVMMTPAGAQLAGKARALLADAEDFERHARALIDPLHGDFHVGLVPTLAPYLLAHCMDLLSATLPDVTFYLHEQQTAVLCRRLNAGELDMLILPWKKELEEFSCTDLFKEPLLLAAKAGHPLLNRSKLRLSSLEGQQVLTLEDGHCLREDTLDVCFAAGAEEDQRFQATSLETLRLMVANGTGITLMPSLAVERNNTAGLIYKRFGNPQPARQICAVVRPGCARMACVNEINRVIQKVITPLL